MALERCCIGRGVAAVRHRSRSASFTYYSMQSLRKSFDQFETEGTVFGSIGKKDFLGLKLVLPSPEIISTFDSIAAPMDERIRTNEMESRILAELRETLLPKLLSGEIRVRDAEAQLAATA